MKRKKIGDWLLRGGIAAGEMIEDDWCMFGCGRVVGAGEVD